MNNSQSYIVNRQSYIVNQNNHASWHLTVAPWSGDFGPAKPLGLSADLYHQSFKTTDAFSNLKTCNALLYVMAGQEANRMGVDEMVISNNSGHIAEFISGNLFIRKNKVVITPPLSDGCIDGVMRRQVMILLIEMNVAVEERSLMADDLTGADELWCTNVIRGVDWIGNLGKAGYGSTMANQVNGWLNEKWLK